MKAYLPWTPDQPYLLPPNPRDWLPEGHLAPFLLEVVESLDLSAIERAIHEKDPRGERPYHPRMMLAVLLYGYCTGTFSSRKIYRRHKCIPEPVTGQIKQAMGFRRFSMRGMAKAGGEWSLVCTSHNLRKSWRARLAGVQVAFGR